MKKWILLFIVGAAALVSCKKDSDPDYVMAVSLSLNRNTLELAVGETETPQVTFNPKNSTDPLLWESRNTAVATVDLLKGTIEAIRPGTAWIVVGSGDWTPAPPEELTDSCLVTVVEK